MSSLNNKSNLGTDRRRVTQLAIAALISMTLASCIDVGVFRKDHPVHHRIYGFANPSGKKGTNGIQFFADRTRLALTGRGETRAPALEPKVAASGWKATGTRDAAQWLGHAAVRLRLNGQEFLVDPAFAHKMSPLMPFGPRRSSPPVIPLEELAKADAIIVSHNHFDHFEPRTIARISTSGKVRCLLPLKVKAFYRLNCPVTELDWLESAAVGPVRATLLPSVHESGRGILDRNHSLWGSWLLESKGKRVYIHGDGGYGPQFKAVAQMRGRCDVDLAVFSVGGYEPSVYNRDVHMSPEEAVRAAHDLCAKKVLIVHWGTYALGLETNAETIGRLREAARKTNLPKGVLVIRAIGDTIRF